MTVHIVAQFPHPLALISLSRHIRHDLAGRLIVKLQHPNPELLHVDPRSRRAFPDLHNQHYHEDDKDYVGEERDEAVGGAESEREATVQRPEDQERYEQRDGGRVEQVGADVRGGGEAGRRGAAVLGDEAGVPVVVAGREEGDGEGDGAEGNPEGGWEKEEHLSVVLDRINRRC